MKLFLVHVLDKRTNKLEKVQVYHTNKSTASNYLQRHWAENLAYDYKIVKIEKIEETSGDDSLNTIFAF